MNKRLFSIFIVIAILLSGCSRKQDIGKELETAKWVPELTSEDIRPYAIRTIEIIDAYLNFQMDWDTAKKELGDVFFRISEVDIIERDPWIHSADRQIRSAISDVYGYRKTDAEYRYWKDYLCFYIGEDVSGTVYPANKEIYNYTEGYDAAADFVKLVDVPSVPFMSGTARNGESGKSITLNFDQMNGVKISDLKSYIEAVWGKLKENGQSSAAVSVYYSQFEQPIFRIYISTNPNGVFYGCVQRNDAPYQRAYDEILFKYSFEERMEFEKTGKYPDGLEILGQPDLYNFQSIECLTEAISIASKFAGME